jgi:hypothetical protein
MDGREIRYVPWHEIYDEFERRLVGMIRQAEVMRDKFAFSWRPDPVLVGCVTLGLNADGHYKEFMGANYTVTPTPRPMPADYPKPCGERESDTACRKEGYRPVGCTIFTDHNQTDDITGKIEELFTSCHTCVSDVFRDYGYFTPVVTARRRRPGDLPELGNHPEFVMLRRTVLELRAFHKIPQYKGFIAY